MKRQLLPYYRLRGIRPLRAILVLLMIQLATESSHWAKNQTRANELFMAESGCGGLARKTALELLRITGQKPQRRAGYFY